MKILGKRQGTNRLNQSVVGAPLNSVMEPCGSQKQETGCSEKKSCCSKDTSLSNISGQELDNIYSANQQSNNSQVLDNVYDKTSEMDAGDIVEQCQQ